jgi:hypothetical protein
LWGGVGGGGALLAPPPPPAVVRSLNEGDWRALLALRRSFAAFVGAALGYGGRED